MSRSLVKVVEGRGKVYCPLPGPCRSAMGSPADPSGYVNKVISPNVNLYIVYRPVMLFNAGIIRLLDFTTVPLTFRT